MSEKLTFKEYLESKQRLREAVAKVPNRTATYTIRKYCKLPIGESKEEKQQISLKPRQQLEIEWLYEDIDDPTVVAIKFINVTNILTESNYPSYWPGKRLQKWLERNAREEN